MRLLAMSTTVSLIARSFVVLFLCAISAASSVSLARSSASFSLWLSASNTDASSGEVAPAAARGVSYMRLKSTKTAGTKEVCLRIHIGAISPSG